MNSTMNNDGNMIVGKPFEYITGKDFSKLKTPVGEDFSKFRRLQLGKIPVNPSRAHRILDDSK